MMAAMTTDTIRDAYVVVAEGFSSALSVEGLPAVSMPAPTNPNQGMIVRFDERTFLKVITLPEEGQG